MTESLREVNPLLTNCSTFSRALLRNLRIWSEHLLKVCVCALSDLLYKHLQCHDYKKNCHLMSVQFEESTSYQWAKYWDLWQFVRQWSKPTTKLKPSVTLLQSSLYGCLITYTGTDFNAQQYSLLVLLHLVSILKKFKSLQLLDVCKV